MGLKDFICHLRNSHNKNIEVAEKDFESLSAFLISKEEEERRGNSSYVRHCAPQTTENSLSEGEGFASDGSLDDGAVRNLGSDEDSGDSNSGNDSSNEGTYTRPV